MQPSDRKTSRDYENLEAHLLEDDSSPESDKPSF